MSSQISKTFVNKILGLITLYVVLNYGPFEIVGKELITNLLFLLGSFFAVQYYTSKVLLAAFFVHVINFHLKLLVEEPTLIHSLSEGVNNKITLTSSVLVIVSFVLLLVALIAKKLKCKRDF